MTAKDSDYFCHYFRLSEKKGGRLDELIENGHPLTLRILPPTEKRDYCTLVIASDPKYIHPERY